MTQVLSASRAETRQLRREEAWKADPARMTQQRFAGGMGDESWRLAEACDRRRTEQGLPTGFARLSSPKGERRVVAPLSRRKRAQSAPRATTGSRGWQSTPALKPVPKVLTCSTTRIPPRTVYFHMIGYLETTRD